MILYFDTYYQTAFYQWCTNLHFYKKSTRGPISPVCAYDLVTVFFGFFKIIFLFCFVLFWLRWVFVAAHGLSLVAASGGYSSLRCAGLSLRWPLPLQSMGSRHAGFSSCGSRAPELRLNCSAWAQLLCSTWDLPRPGLEPVSSVLAGRLLTTAPPGKPWSVF